MSENILGTEKISKLFLKFCAPAVAAMVICGMQGMIDGIFVGNLVGEIGLASVNIAQPFMQLIYGCTFIVCIGSMSLLGRLLGEGNEKGAQDVFRTSTVALVIMSIIVAFLGVLFNKKIAVILGANEELIVGVSTYIKTIAIFAPIISIKTLFGFTDRIIGKPNVYLNATIISVIIQILLNILFVYKLELGIQGAALATGISNIGALIVVVPYMLDKKNKVNIFKGKFNKEFIWPICYNGSSEGVTSLATAISTFLFNMAFMNIAGPAGVAAFTAITYIANFGVLLMFGVSDGIGPIVSYNYGYEKFKRVREGIKLSLMSTFIIGVAVFSILFVFGEDLVSLFSKSNTEVISLAANGARVYAIAFLFNGFNIVNSGYFTSIGNAKASIIVAASRGLIFIIIGIMILPLIFGINGIWLTVPFAEIITVIIGIITLRK